MLGQQGIVVLYNTVYNTDGEEEFELGRKLALIDVGNDRLVVFKLVRSVVLIGKRNEEKKKPSRYTNRHITCKFVFRFTADRKNEAKRQRKKKKTKIG